MQHLPVQPTERARAMAAHPAAQARGSAPATEQIAAASAPAAVRHAALPRAGVGTAGRVLLAEEDGSLVTEYGLLAVVAATVAGVVIQWASGGALVTLFNALLRHARSLVGA